METTTRPGQHLPKVSPRKRILRSLLMAPLTLGVVLAIPAGASAAPDPVDGHALGAAPVSASDLASVPRHSSTAQAALPTKVDLSASVPPVGNQGAEGSCVAWSIGYYYAGYQEAVEHKWSLTDTTHQFSPSFVYNQINGGRDGGSSPTTAMSLLASKGVASLASMPYKAGDYTTQPNALQLQDAKPYTVGTYAYFQRNDIAGMKAHLAAGDLVSLTIPVYSNFDYPSSPATTPIGIPAGGWTDRSYRGDHEITIVGYDDAKQAFRIVNSWGTGWADKGYAWMSYNFVSNRSNPSGATYYYSYTMAGKADTLSLLTGQVTDATTHAALAGATVTAGGLSVTTDVNGNYTLAVAAGKQTVQVSASGHTASSQAVTLTAGVPQTVSVALAKVAVVAPTATPVKPTATPVKPTATPTKPAATATPVKH